MPEKKTDRRVEKTRRAIKLALAELLSTKELRKVTVQEIADLADVNRVTFYKHYLDVYDLYDQFENEILVELGQIILEYEDTSAEDAFAKLLDYIDNNHEIFKMLFSPYSAGQLRDKFNRLVVGLFRAIHTEMYNQDINDISIEFLSSYHSHGCISIIEKWVRGDYVQTKDFVLGLISELDEQNEKYLTARFIKK